MEILAKLKEKKGRITRKNIFKKKKRAYISPLIFMEEKEMSEKNFEEIPNRRDTLEFRMYILKELIALKNNHEENKDFETFHH